MTSIAPGHATTTAQRAEEDIDMTITAPVLYVESQVRIVEEPHLQAVHGHGYAVQVGRFIPGIGRVRTSMIPDTDATEKGAGA